MSRTVRAKKLDGKSGQFVYFSCFFPKLWFLNCQKLALYIRSFRKWSVLYVPEQNFMRHGRKNIKNKLTQQKHNKILQFQTLISSKYQFIA